jgi:outer membrane receptor protein involved in Fe transport
MTPRIDELVPGFGETEPSSSEFWFSPNDRVFAHIRHEREDWIWDADWRFDLGWQRIVDDRTSRDYQSTIRRYEENRSDLFGITASANRETDNGSWIAGVEIYHDDVASRRVEEDILTGSRQQVASRFPDGSTMDQAALYGNYLRDIGDRHTLSGGLRYSVIVTELPQVGVVPGVSVDQDDVSADLGWVFDATDSLQVTANLGYGFRAPNVFDLGTLGERPGNRFNIPNPDLESERITQFDVGLRHRGSRVDIDAAVFALHYIDRITSVSTGATTPDGRDITQSRNVDNADIVGVEIGGVWRISDSLEGNAVLNYVRGEQSDEGGADVPGDRIPPVNGRIGLSYRFSESLELEPFAMFAAEQDRLSPRDVRDPRVDPDGTPGWITLNIRAVYDLNDAWRMTASVENLFDERYRVHGSGIDAPGRNLYVSVQYGW